MGESNLSKRSTREAEDVRAYIAPEIRKLLAITDFLDSLPSYLLSDKASQVRISRLLERLKKIAAS
jgi:hypothetical protein